MHHRRYDSTLKFKQILLLSPTEHVPPSTMRTTVRQLIQSSPSHTVVVYYQLSLSASVLNSIFSASIAVELVVLDPIINFRLDHYVIWLFDPISNSGLILSLMIIAIKS